MHYNLTKFSTAFPELGSESINTTSSEKSMSIYHGYTTPTFSQQEGCIWCVTLEKISNRYLIQDPPPWTAGGVSPEQKICVLFCVTKNFQEVYCTTRFSQKKRPCFCKCLRFSKYGFARFRFLWPPKTAIIASNLWGVMVIETTIKSILRLVITSIF